MNEMKIMFKNIGEIVPYENNPRHNEQAVDAVAASIREFGFKVPIVLDSNGVIVTGHTRLKAAKLLGMDQVPCITADDLTDEQIKAFRLADSKVAELATWDIDKLNIELGEIEFDMSEFGFDDIEVEDIELDEIEDDEPPTPPMEPRTKPGDIYRVGEHFVMCGDSTKPADVRRLANGTLADLLLTDPPYNCDYASKNESLNKADKGNRIQDDIEGDNMPDDEFIQFIAQALQSADNVMRDGAPFYIWCVDHKIQCFIESLGAVPWKWHQTLIWVKNNLVLGHCDYQKKHEPCLYGWKDGAEHFFIDDRTQVSVIEDKADLKKLSKDELRRMLEDILDDGISTTVIHEDKPQVNDLHPTMKPVKLFARLIRNSSRPGDTVLDLFGGSGTTLIACEQLGRRALIMEKEPKYVDVILDRYQAFTGIGAVRINAR